MKILLINATEFSFKAYSLGLLYIGAVLEKAGHNVSLYDEQYESGVPDTCYDMIGISCMTTRTDHVLNLVDDIRKSNKNIPIVFGGAHATILPETLVRYQNDYAVIGEGEQTIVKLVDYLEGNGEFPTGVVFKVGDNRTLRSHFPQPIPNIDVIPYPARHLLNPRYFKSHRHNMICSRGCPYNCSFCQPTLRMIFGDKVRYRSPENIAGEIKELQDKYDARLIIFHDDTMTANKEWLLRVCDEIKPLGIKWECQGRVNTIDKEMVTKMKKSGCVVIRFGVESGSQTILNGLRKGITVQQIKDAFRVCRDVGIETQAHIMIGSPHESLESIKATRKLVAEIKPTRLYCTITTPMPMTQLWEDMGMTEKHVNWADFNPSGQKSMMEIENLSSEQIAAIRNDILKKFWVKRLFSPRFVWQTIRTHSLKECFDTFNHLMGGD